MSAVPGPQALPFEISGIPKLVVIRLICRDIPAESASLADNPPCTHLDKQFTVGPGSPGRVHLRHSFRRAFRTLDATNGVTHTSDSSFSGASFRSEFAVPISGRDSSVHEEVAAGDERAVPPHQESANRPNLKAPLMAKAERRGPRGSSIATTAPCSARAETLRWSSWLRGSITSSPLVQIIQNIACSTTNSGIG